MSPTIKQSGLFRHRLQQRLHQHDVDHRGLVEDQTVAVEWVVVAAFEAAAFGVDLQQTVDRFGLKAGRLSHALCSAACRRAEQDLTPLRRGSARWRLTIVVLPTPGPPVITSTFELSARRTAATWLSASVRPMCFSTHGKALSGSIQGHGERAICEPYQPIRNRALRPMQTGQEYDTASRQPGRRSRCPPAAPNR